jgi:hypothetical protein
MKKLRHAIGLGVFLAILLPVACVTINIYFPAEEVESVAGEIVNDIRGRQSETPQKNEETEKDQSFLRFSVLVASLTPSAWAEDATTVSNATIRELKSRMQTRYERLKPYFASGALKEGDDGYVAMRSIDSLSVREKSELRNLVAAENRDREQLYREVARAMNIDAGQVDRIAQIFAKEWQKSTP